MLLLIIAEQPLTVNYEKIAASLDCAPGAVSNRFESLKKTAEESLNELSLPDPSPGLQGQNKSSPRKRNAKEISGSEIHGEQDDLTGDELGGREDGNANVKAESESNEGKYSTS